MSEIREAISQGQFSSFTEQFLVNRQMLKKQK
jgi:queuine/archaeosine tRNA-ribosyltransferase